MKKDLDTVSVDLNRETVYVQISGSFLEEEWRSREWQMYLYERMAYEVHIVMKGACRINIEGRVYPLRAGQLMVIAPRQYHGCRSEAGDFERFSFCFLPDEKATSLRAALQERIGKFRIAEATDAMTETAGAILRDWNTTQPYRMEMRQALLSQLMIDTVRQMAPLGGEREDLSGEPSRMLLCDAYFSENTAGRTAAQLAEILHMSERQMNRCLQEFYGMSFRQKLAVTRMERAAWLLRHSERSAEEIAALIGYESESGFFKAFRKHCGMTPLQYRAANRARQ